MNPTTCPDLEESFDPYYKWLGIPPEEQPPNHYRLLGIRLFEEDRDVIQSAASGRSAHLKNMVLGKHQALSQRLLNEVHQAKLCLLTPEDKAAYDARLRQELQSKAAQALPPATPPTLEQRAPAAASEIRPVGMWSKRRLSLTVLIGAAAAAAVVLLGVIVYVVTGEGDVKIDLSDPTAKVEVKNESAPPPASQSPATTAPPLAIAPFDEKKAKEHQEAWAKHLGVPVEITNSIGMKLVLIPPGEFMMGSTDAEVESVRSDVSRRSSPVQAKYARDRLSHELPQHRVAITSPFYLGVHEVTQADYAGILGANPSYFSATGEGKDAVAGQDTGQFPVEQVTWDEAQEFCRRLALLAQEKAARRAYRLPTEAEWEYACRAGTATSYYFGDDPEDLGEHAWFEGTASLFRSYPVGQKTRNPWGLYDTYGNVYEWCADLDDAKFYATSPAVDPLNVRSGDGHVCRGGSWENAAAVCRSAFRASARASGKPNRRVGIRVATDVVVSANREGESRVK